MKMSTRKLFNFNFIKNLQISWVQRYRALFFNFFAKKSLKELVVVSNSTKPASSTSISQPSKAPQQKRTMHSSTITKATAVRIPLIKFIGARLPRPHFDSASLPPLQISGNFASPVSSPAKASSIGPVGKIPRGQGIEYSQLPAKFRRLTISEEEIEAVNKVFVFLSTGNTNVSHSNEFATLKNKGKNKQFRLDSTIINDFQIVSFT